MSRTIFQGVLLALTVLMSSLPLVAQGSGILMVRVTDSAGASLRSAAVLISDETGRELAVALTDADGRARFPGMEPGEYSRVRVPSVWGDGTGVFASSVQRRLPIDVVAPGATSEVLDCD